MSTYSSGTDKGKDLELEMRDSDSTKRDSGACADTLSPSTTPSGTPGMTVPATTTLDWDGPADPANPYNWSTAKRWYGTLVPGFFCLVV